MKLVIRKCNVCGKDVLWDRDARDVAPCTGDCEGYAQVEGPTPWLPEDLGHDPYNHCGRLFNPDLPGWSYYKLGAHLELTSPTFTVFDEASDVTKDMYRVKPAEFHRD